MHLKENYLVVQKLPKQSLQYIQHGNMPQLLAFQILHNDLHFVRSFVRQGMEEVWIAVVGSPQQYHPTTIM